MSQSIAGRLRPKRSAANRGRALHGTEVAVEALQAAGGAWAVGGALVDAAVAWRATATERVNAALRDSATERGHLPVVVLVDDVDRLDATSLHELFATIYALDEQAPVIFVLAMDPGEVAHLIERGRGVRNGMEYLEKMLNILVPISPPSSAVLLGEAIEEISAIMKHAGVDVDGDFPLRCEIVLTAHLRTPRDLRRIVNQMHVTAASAARAELRAR